MSTQPHLILAPRATDDSVRIWRAALAEAWDVQRLPSWRVPEGISAAGADMVIYGEPLFAEAVADQLDLILLEPPPDWTVSLPQRFRKRTMELTTLEAARKATFPAFIKPAEGKVFEARVYDSGAGLPLADMVDDSLPVICSEFVSWTLEVRCFVLAGRVEALSPYWRQEAMARAADGEWPFEGTEEADALRFAEEVIQAGDVRLPPAFVLDIGITAENGWAVVEGNPCWGAGLYGCSPSSALKTIRHAFRRKSDMAETDWQWTSPRVALKA